jgi:nitric oxide dioxygenase
MLSAAAKPYIDASVPVLREHGLAITSTFYRNMLGEHPELKNLFNMGNQAQGTQQQSLAHAVFAYAANIENPEVLAPVVSRIVHKHASLGIKPEHYPIVGRHLLRAIRETLGNAANDALIDAWAEAYGLLADALIAEERKLYAAADTEPGQMQTMRVTQVRPEGESMKSFRLEPIEGQPLRPFLPGQYVSVEVRFANGARQLRQYSLSDAPSRPWYRISVKREMGEQPGQVSNWLHDNLNVGDLVAVSPPFGDFQPVADHAHPVILLSAGAGITPMVAMLNHLAETRPQQDVLFAHAARSRHHHAHLDDVRRAAKRMPALKVVDFYESMEGVTPQESVVHAGRMAVSVLPPWQRDIANVYLCGPQAFMKQVWGQLRAAGVPVERIHREVFGPALLEHLS